MKIYVDFLQRACYVFLPFCRALRYSLHRQWFEIRWPLICFQFLEEKKQRLHFQMEDGRATTGNYIRR